jgi:plasmid stabilization system protein ParE
VKNTYFATYNNTKTMEIIWTNTALESFEEIVDYITAKFTLKEANDFINSTDSIINMIKQNSRIGRPYKKTIYRQFLISEQTYLFYKLENNKIYLSIFWNNSKNPLDLDAILRS